MWYDSLIDSGYDVTMYPILIDRGFFLRWLNNMSSWFWRVPVFGKMPTRLYKILLNRHLIIEFNKQKYDYFFTYNGYNEIDKLTMQYIKKRVKGVFCIYGDNPLFDPGMRFNFLEWSRFTDVALVFDRYQKLVFDMYDNFETVLLPAGSDSSRFYPYKPNHRQLEEYGCDLLFVGNALSGNHLWGDHRARILNNLADYNLRVYGDVRWKKHFLKYPELEKVVIFKKLSTEQLNIAHNCTKIYIAITNATVVDGVITRVFDALASGTFVIYEHRKYLNDLFGDLIPTFSTIAELKNKVDYYLTHDAERVEIANKARSLCIDNYQVKNNIDKIKHYIRNQDL
jgi:spore maturation protein CgeB